MMMMSSSDEENDDDNVVHAQAAKETTDRINAELLNNGKNMFPTYHSIALSGDASDGGLNGVGMERKGAHKGKKRKSKDILFESVALQNKDKSERIEIADGIFLPAPIRKKTTQKLGFGLTHDGINDEDYDEDDNKDMSVKDEAMKARGIYVSVKRRR